MRCDKRALCVLGALCAVPAFAGCNVDFDPSNEVHGLRVLAVRAEPPTVALGGATTLDALAVTPDDGPTALSWELCAYTLGEDDLRLCPEEAVLASGEGETLAFDDTAAVAARVAPYCDPAAVSSGQLPDGAQLLPCGAQGFPATVRLVAAGEGEEIVSVKTVYLELPQDPGASSEPNKNPIIGELSGAPDAIAPGGAGTASCTVDEASVETVEEPDGGLGEEEIDTRWFIAGGSLKNDVGTEVEFLADKGAARVTLWCVVQDGRGGVDFARRDVPVEP